MSLERPTYAEFVKHAKLCGVELIYETAEVYLGPEELVRLKVRLNVIALQHRRAKKPRCWFENPPKVGRDDAVSLFETGLTLEEVVQAVGKPVSSTRKWLYPPPEQAEQRVTSTEKVEKPV